MQDHHGSRQGQNTFTFTFTLFPSAGVMENHLGPWGVSKIPVGPSKITQGAPRVFKIKVTPGAPWKFNTFDIFANLRHLRQPSTTFPMGPWAQKGTFWSSRARPRGAVVNSGSSDVPTLFGPHRKVGPWHSERVHGQALTASTPPKVACFFRPN